MFLWVFLRFFSFILTLFFLFCGFCFGAILRIGWFFFFFLILTCSVFLCCFLSRVEVSLHIWISFGQQLRFFYIFLFVAVMTKFFAHVSCLWEAYLFNTGARPTSGVFLRVLHRRGATSIGQFSGIGRDFGVVASGVTDAQCTYSLASNVTTSQPAQDSVTGHPGPRPYAFFVFPDGFLFFVQPPLVHGSATEGPGGRGPSSSAPPVLPQSWPKIHRGKVGRRRCAIPVRVTETPKVDLGSRPRRGRGLRANRLRRELSA